MAWTFAEGLVDATISYFDTNLGGVLDGIDTEKGDGIILNDPVTIERAERTLKSIQSYPVMVVLVDNMTVGQWNGAEAWGEYQLMVGMIVLDQDPTTLRKRLYRYGRAFMEVLANAHGDGGIGFHIGVGDINIGFSPLFSSGESQYIGDVSALVPVVLKEAR